MSKEAEVFATDRFGLSAAPDIVKSAPTKEVRVLIADDHPVMRKGVIKRLARHEHLTVVGEAQNGHEAIAKARELSPDIVLMDIDMPKLNGLGAAAVLHRERPRTKVLVLSVDTPTHYAQQMLRAGVRGYWSKRATTEELIQAIETVAAGGDWFTQDVVQAVLNELAGETEGAGGVSCRPSPP